MAFILLIAFITVPILEIAVFIQVGEQIGLWSTIGIVILTAVIGTAMLRQQGLSVLFRIQENLEANRMPVQELFDGVCLVVAGALLLTPGFVTDSIGFLLFIPPFRHWLASEIGRRVIARADVHYTSHSYTSRGPHPGGAPGRGGPVIDGDYQDVTDTGPDDTPPERLVGKDDPRRKNSE